VGRQPAGVDTRGGESARCHTNNAKPEVRNVKTLVAGVLGLWSMAALADSPNWVEIARPMSDTGVTVVYFDIANPIVDGSFRGYLVKTVLAAPFLATDGTKLAAVESVFVVDCTTGEGKAHRQGFVGTDGAEYPTSDTGWRPITKPPATDTLQAVRLRVCGAPP
jgi:hypothetical protein